MTYTSASNVLPYVRTLFKGGTFGEDTTPTSTDVDAWLDAGYSRINGELAAHGYGVPVSSGATCYDHIAHLEALYAAAWIYQVRLVQANTGTAETKGNALMQAFEREMDRLFKADLSLSGVSVSSDVGEPYAGGISVSDKSSVEEDSDRVSPRFRRGQHDVPGVSWNSTSAS